MTQDEITILIEKYLAGNATLSEKLALMEWYRSISQSDQEIWLHDESEKDLLQQQMLEVLQNRIAAGKPVIDLHAARKKWITKAAVAASIILLLGAGYWWLQNSRASSIEKPQLVVSRDVPAPAVAKATLKLADNSIVYLDSAGPGSLATQGNVHVVKRADGKIIYESSTNYQPSTIQYNTISNPRGSKVISLALADGSQIWLNAASSITYPTAFAGAERKVQISGEAYFKVVHNNKMPFKVAIDNIEVTDLGTEFNIRAYNDEKEIQATLVEGMVKVSRVSNNESIFIKPGEQAIVADNSAINIIQPDVLDEITAWREGLFHYESTELPVILKEFSRWYDIDVEYSGKIPTDKYFLIFKRSSSLVTVLDALKATGVKFQVQGRKLMVQPG